LIPKGFPRRPARHVPDPPSNPTASSPSWSLKLATWLADLPLLAAIPKWLHLLDEELLDRHLNEPMDETSNSG
jgi:hypothetical protein